MRYRYAGPAPQDDGQGGIVRPGEERDYDSEPGWGPWDAVDAAGTLQEAPGAPQAPVPTQVPAPASPGPAAASPAPPAPFGTETSPGGM